MFSKSQCQEIWIFHYLKLKTPKRPGPFTSSRRGEVAASASKATCRFDIPASEGFSAGWPSTFQSLLRARTETGACLTPWHSRPSMTRTAARGMLVIPTGRCCSMSCMQPEYICHEYNGVPPWLEGIHSGRPAMHRSASLCHGVYHHVSFSQGEEQGWQFH